MSTNDERRFSGCTIQHGSNFRFHKADDLNWICQKRRVAKKGKNAGVEVWENLSYHPTLGIACKYLAQNLADESVDVEDLMGYADRLLRIGKDIEETCNEFVQGVKP